MSTPERPSAEAIRNAVAQSGLNLSDDDLRRLAAGNDVLLEDHHEGAGREGAAAARRCPGFLIYRITAVCGIYLLLNPTRFRVCCEFPG